MEIDNAVLYKGFLLLPPIGKILIKKSWQKKYCLLFKASKFGRERLEIYDSVDTKTGQAKIITLENVVKIATKSLTTFNIITKTSEYEFTTLTEESLNEWISAIQSVAFPDEVSKITSIEEDNDLYCSSGEGVFNVKVHNSSASQKCGLENKYYTLVLTSTAIQLRNNLDNQLLFTWPYCYIRRYGYKGGKFTFEAGRKCDSGEGTFFLEHSNQQEIFRCLASKMKSMKKLLVGDSTNSLLDCGESQLHAALNMEARSRSPLPPSPTSPPISDSDFSQKSHITVLDFDRSVKKPMPKKPPRKLLTTKPASPSNVISGNNFPEYSVISNSGQDYYEPIDKYDRVEIRNDAWKTLGISEISHTEQVNTSDNDAEEEYISWGQVKKQVENIHPTLNNTIAPSVITESTSKLSDSSYDRLNFFGSTSKLNAGYKQVYPMPLPPTPSLPSFNHYDEVQVMDSVRPADDSHLGYALIRKEPGKDALKPIPLKRVNKDDAVNHKFCNNEPYAMISKPKRV